jgi:uncharacterized RDD family membrane protein YckC
MADLDQMELANPEHMAYQGIGIRFVSLLIDGIIGYLIGAILIWRSDKKQRLGDRVAKTIVVKAGN